MSCFCSFAINVCWAGNTEKNVLLTLLKTGTELNTQIHFFTVQIQIYVLYLYNLCMCAKMFFFVQPSICKLRNGKIAHGANVAQLEKYRYTYIPWTNIYLYRIMKKIKRTKRGKEKDEEGEEYIYIFIYTCIYVCTKIKED